MGNEQSLNTKLKGKTITIGKHKYSFVKLISEGLYFAKFLNEIRLGGYGYVFLVKDSSGKSYALKRMVAMNVETKQKILLEIEFMVWFEFDLTNLEKNEPF